MKHHTLEQLEKEYAKKFERRGKKKRPVMKVSGKSVIVLKRIIVRKTDKKK